MNIIAVDDDRANVIMLQKILDKLDKSSDHRYYTDPLKVLEELDKPIETAFVDIGLPHMNGLELAERITARYPLCNVIFLTAHSEYALRAFEMHASGYIMKPFDYGKIEDALTHLRFRTPYFGSRPLQVQCFGSFEVFVNGEPVKFGRQKSKELLAYLIDRRGALCSMDMMIGNVEPDRPDDEASRSRIRVYIGDLKVTFLRLGIDDLIVRSSGTFAVDPALLDCDYYRYLSGDPYAISRYSGEYMTQYSFAEETRAFLEMKYYGGFHGDE
ncbi:response regulator [Ruminococcus sp.]|uniref:response regulator n=1 Tax=Ruminococcus sp. TaxID=41978 RepID=UPI0025CBBEC7|nr:response regulator [Ruminococcus sp.]MBQ8966926.1 response regulator [Ruminococcus sp.]